ncbi:TPR-repeat-containing protein [Vibrio angustum S14]|uniref:TPR-repeat-containing protein n=2 Tax=Photobacterium angustum TaxID=661 RepID=Q1ZLE9_PHOAS|nr:TPR-repeat-containing protein [Vibrio angustum S14] [Photobacterium angustum S14]
MMKSIKHMLASLTLAAGVLSAPAAANENPQLSDRTFRTVNKVQELIAEEKYNDAISKLNKALSNSSKKKYDRAVLLQQMGFLYSLKDNYPKAAKYFSDALKADALPVPVAQQVRYSLAQLYLAEEQYKKSVNTMNTWFKVAKTTKEKPPAHAYITLASAYVQMGNYRNAITPTKKAISMTKSPNESWYLLLVSSHYELKQYKSVASVLKTLTNKYPKKKRYWMQLSGVYMELNQNKNALATLEAAYKLGLLEGEKEHLRLVNFMAYQGIPHRAAKIMAQEMVNKNIARTHANIEKQASFYHQAKELDEAISIYKQAFKIAPSGKQQIRIVKLMIQDKQFKQATAFANNSSNAKRDEKAELAYLKGMAYFELDQHQNALKAMKTAAQSSSMKSSAEPWIAFLEDQS